MKPIIWKNTKSYFIRLLLLCCILHVTAVGYWSFKSGNDFTKHCNRVAAAKQAEIFERVELEAAAERARKLAAYLKRLADDDRAKSLERQAWIEQIDLATTRYFKRNNDNRNSLFSGSFVNYRMKQNFPTQPTKSKNGAAKSSSSSRFWSEKRIQRTNPPNVRGDNESWCKNPIDQFIVKRLDEAGLKPNLSATPRTLARRLVFDITGLPLSETQTEYWNSTIRQPSNPTSYAEFIDSLLANPSFGEHWARAWLDVAGYADSNGYEEDEIRDKAYTYRDFVIWALNNDLPFDEFARWQIAGDELAPENPMAVAATGFLTTAPYNTFFPQESERMDELDSMVSTYSAAMLGMTVGCARCHDHMYDNISTREYYRLVSIFSETKRSHSYLVPDQGKHYRKFFDPVDARRQELEEMQFRRIKEDRIANLEHFTEAEKDILRKPIDPQDAEQERLLSLCERCLLVKKRHLSDDFEPLPQDQERYDELILELKKLEPKLPECPPKGLTLTGSSVSTFPVLQSGKLNTKQHAEKVGPGFLAILTDDVDSWDENQWKRWALDPLNPRPRSALACWTTDVEQGAGALAARVIVNRIWQQYFGNGLVATAGDFGYEGDPPTHPDLLEWLAAELVDNDWSLKHIHRLILNSATYQQDATVTKEQLDVDPENRLLGRFVPRRISAEMFRDSILSISGRLNSRMYGPAVMPPIPRDAVFNTQEDAENTWPIDYEVDRESLWRRGIYVLLKRTVPVPMLRLFDAPDGSFACQKRKTSTLPTQALALFNSPFVLSQSQSFAERVANRESEPREQVELLVKLAFGRNATIEEIDVLSKYLLEQPAQPVNGWQLKNLQLLCQVLFMSNEFFYIN